MQNNQATVVVSKEMKWKIKEQALKEKITMIELMEKALQEYFDRL